MMIDIDELRERPTTIIATSGKSYHESLMRCYWILGLVIECLEAGYSPELVVIVAKALRKLAQKDVEL